ncbi:hypothetical protein YC2023_015932 [Brassica napus]|uniref:Uncharacterized protein n=1 Tax=Brassica oleracea TaxID=3712 RepID=A0A3P6CTD5_BRAOL|nr:unnamed protein product [Brassica oleracea]
MQKREKKHDRTEKMKKMKRNDEESRRLRENTFRAPEDMCLNLFLILMQREYFYDRLSEGPLRHLACSALRATVLARRGSLCMVWSTFAPGVLLSSRCCHPPPGFIDADYGYFPDGVDGLYSWFL